MVAGHQVRKDGCGYIMDATRPTSDGIVYGFQDRPRDYEVYTNSPCGSCSPVHEKSTVVQSKRFFVAKAVHFCCYC